MANDKKDVSTLTQKESEQSIEVEKVKYTDKEQTYYGNLLKRLANAKNMRDRRHDEFDGQTYLEWCESNRKGANTYIQPKKDKYDTNFSAGTIRQKMEAYLAALNNLDLNPDIQTFDKNNVIVGEIGQSMEDILFKIGEIDNDEEKKFMRQYSLLEQGTVFVTEDWEEIFRKRKSFKGAFNGKIVKDQEFPATLKKERPRCIRTIEKPENMYLGDIYTFDMKKQPYFYKVKIKSWDEAKAKYGKWDRWQFVPKKIIQVSTGVGEGKLYSNYQSFDTNLKDEVEIVEYQDKWNDEYMILINGVMMLPVGFPLSAVTPTGEYTTEKQILGPISPFFAYGKSLVAKMKNNAAILDEMYRMAVKKTQKSYAPPQFNNSGRVLSSRVFAPGMITMGVDPEKIGPIDPNSRGVESAEFKMLEMVQGNIDKSSVDPTYQGQQPQGTPTATQILEVQRQAKMMIGLTVFVCSQLEKKLAWLRIYNVLHNWFKPIGGYSDPISGEFIRKYRSVNNRKLIEGAGEGQQIVRLADKLPESKDIMIEENKMSEETGIPTRINYLLPDEIKKSNYTWFVSVIPKERKTDALNKVIFDEFAQKAMMFPNINMEFLSERFAEIWGENPAKLFQQAEEMPPEEEGMEEEGEEPAGPGQQVPGAPQPPGLGNSAGPMKEAGLGKALAQTSE